MYYNEYLFTLSPYSIDINEIFFYESYNFKMFSYTCCIFTGLFNH